MSLEDLETKERYLANQLKNFCTSFHDEKKSKLSESTEILYHMGCLYVRKADITECMDQQLNFIKAATLLHAARIRSEISLKRDQKSEEILQSINEMETLLVQKCSGNLSSPLLEISRDVSRAFESYRAEEKRILDSLQVIEEGLPEGEALKRRNKKIEIVKILLRNNSGQFKKQMQRIAKDCLDVKEPSPCDFAIVGLGSLARDEVTLYSDFEHVIILEEGVQNREDYGKILEYFRWYSVVFHIIVIGIGETVIPSVGVESLNDLYSNDKSKNWFFDSFTPLGVSFDGMMPHACKIPIGRRKLTMKKDFTIELIKPVSQMALYLTKDEDMVNEYCLKDVLCETCFVFGSETIYSQFKEEADGILKLEGFNKSLGSISSAVKRNHNPLVSGDVSLNDCGPVDTKFSLYRPLSILIGYLHTYTSRLKRTDGTSGFEKLLKLEGLPLHQHTDSLLWAFAVACEIRLKFYAEDHGRRKKYIGKEVLRYVAKSCFLNCVSAIHSLSCYLVSLPYPYDNGFHISHDIIPFALMQLGENSAAKDAFLDLIRQKDGDRHCSQQPLMANCRIALAEIYIAEAVRGTDSNHFLKEAENTLKEIDNYQKDSSVCLRLSFIYRMQGNYSGVKEFSDAACEIMKKEKVTSITMLCCRQDQIEATKASMKLDDFVEYCKVCLADGPDIASQLIFKLALAQSQCELGEKAEAKRLLGELVNLCTSLYCTEQIPTEMIINWMITIILLQYDERWYVDVFDSFEKFEEVNEFGRRHIDFPLTSLLLAVFHSYLKVGVGENKSGKIELFRKAIRMCEYVENFGELKLSRIFEVILLQEFSFLAVRSNSSLDRKNLRELDVAELHELFSNASAEVVDDIDVKTTIVTSFHRLYSALIFSAECGILEVLHQLAYSCLIMKMPHPSLFPLITQILGKVKGRLHKLSHTMLLSFRDDPLSESSGHGKTMTGRLPCQYLTQVTTNLTQECCKDLKSAWKTLFLKRAGKKAFLDFMNRVYVILCFNHFSRFNSYWENVPFRLSLDADFRNGVKNYSQLNFKCIRQFWKIINWTSNNSCQQKLSITFLCHAVIHFFIRKLGFVMFTDPEKRQLTVMSANHGLKGYFHAYVDETPLTRKLMILSGTTAERVFTECLRVVEPFDHVASEISDEVIAKNCDSSMDQDFDMASGDSDSSANVVSSDNIGLRRHHLGGPIEEVPPKRKKISPTQFESCATLDELDSQNLDLENLMEKRMEIEAVKAQVESADFIGYCEKYLMETNDIPSQMECRLALAKARFELDDKPEAVDILKQVIKLCAADLSCSFPATLRAQWMECAFLMQYSEECFTECVEILELFEEINESSWHVVDPNVLVPNFFSYCAAASYVMVSGDPEQSRTSSEKVKLCEKAIEISKVPGNATECEPVYCEAVALAIEHCFADCFKDCHISKLYNIFLDAPQTVCNGIEVQNFDMVQIKNTCFNREKGIGPLDILHRGYVTCILWKKSQQIANMNWGWLAEKLRTLVEDINGSSKPFNLMKQLESKPVTEAKWCSIAFETEVNQVWVSIIQNPAKRQNYMQFMRHVYNFLCVDTYRLFRSMSLKF